MSADPPPDPDRANVARMYDYFLGGSQNFAVDRALADRVVAADPIMISAIRELRSFLRRTVRHCLERGIDQFLDLGSGIPTVGNVHEIALRADPTARVAYVDNEAVAVQHSREVLRDVETATITFADLRDPDAVLSAPGVAGLLDFSRPVGLLMLAVLHFVPEEPDALAAAYRRVLAPGSTLAVSHISDEWEDAELAESMRRRAALYDSGATPTVLRSRAQIREIFDGMELVDPGLVEISRWRPDATVPFTDRSGVYGAVGVAGPLPVA